MVPGPPPSGPPQDAAGPDPARAAQQRMIVLCGAVMRGAEGLAAAAAALLGAVPPVSMAWVAPAVAIDLLWTALFILGMLRYGPLTRLVLGEVAVTAGFGLAQGRLVVPEAADGGASWIAVLTTMTIVVAALGWRPRVAVPAGLAVTGAHLAGAQLAGLASGTATAAIHLVQVAAMAALMSLLRRSAAVADVALGRLRRASTEAAVLRARRADERAQYSRVHDTVLNMLTMVGAGGVAASSAMLRRQAAADLAELERIAARGVPYQDRNGGKNEAAGESPVRLDARLREITDRGGVRVTAELAALVVPGPVAEAFAGAAAEALTNVARHAGVDAARLSAVRTGDEIRVEIADRGSGFDPARLPSDRYGLRRSIIERMDSIGGGARVESGDGGTLVTLWWRP
ncbi:ATP-binding protein [Thermopolyspora sp. NPDC052614]|uniref:sensor histidine kinase n=1 Tax=Thermopolyspora sp. NPDC052614 TaxID=3155682 RepID=UPI003418F8C1